MFKADVFPILSQDREHLMRIVQICGTPEKVMMDKIDNESARSYLASLPHYPKKDFFSFFVGANPNAIDLLLRLLDMNPDKRPTAEQALSHSYLAKYHDPDDEVTHTHTHRVASYICVLSLSLQPVCDRQYDDSFESMELDVEGWRSELTYPLTIMFTIIIPPPPVSLQS